MMQDPSRVYLLEWLSFFRWPCLFLLSSFLFVLFFLPSPVSAANSDHFQLKDTNYCLNTPHRSNYGNVDIWSCDGGDNDQDWVQDGDLIRLKNTNYCLNTPYRYENGNIFLWECNSSDPDQRWTRDGDLIRLKDTNFCVNTPSRGNGGNVFLWSCNSGDPDQRWVRGTNPPSGPCPSGGLYCGGSVGQDPNHLYHCSGSGANPNLNQTCNNGCQVNPPGTADQCISGACPSGGWYCGSSVGQNASNLYYCSNSGANPSLSQTCNNGCQINPPGTPDQCVQDTDNATFLLDVNVPDGTNFDANENFTKIWRLKNTGNTTWNGNYKLAFQSGEHMSGPSEVYLPHDVSPNSEVDISVNLTAPSNAGSYVSNWKLKNANGDWFGEVVWVSILVSSLPTGECPTGGLYCGSSLGLDHNSLYSCDYGGDDPQAIQSCNNGCQINPQGTPDQCYSANSNSDFCENISYNQWAGSGEYCNGDILTTCSGSKQTVSEYSCGANNCQINPPGTADACVFDTSQGFCENIPSAEWGGAGEYCNGDSLVTCSSSRAAVSESYCGENRCQVNSPGIPDQCLDSASDSNFCVAISSAEWGGAGEYCNGSELVTCSESRATLGSQVCDSGCQQNSPGTADACSVIDVNNPCTQIPSESWLGAGDYCVEGSIISCSESKDFEESLVCANGCSHGSSNTAAYCEASSNESEIIFPIQEESEEFKVESGFGFGEYVSEWKDCYGAYNSSPQTKFYHGGTDFIKSSALGTNEVDGSQSDHDKCKSSAGAKVVAIADGTLIDVVHTSSEGTSIIIKHDGIQENGQPIYSSYFHLDPSGWFNFQYYDSLPFGFGQYKIEKGTELGRIADVGNNPHLHFELKTSANFGAGYTVGDPATEGYLNPCIILKKYGAQVPLSCSNVTPSGGDVPVHKEEVNLQFPENAVSEDLLVSAYKVASNLTPDTGDIQKSLVGSSYELIAQNASGGEVSQFNEDISIGIRYDEVDMVGLDPNSLALNYYDENQSQWVQLTSIVDEQSGTVTGYSNHFTEFAILGEPLEQVGVELLSSPWSLTGNDGASEKYQSISTDALQGMDTLRITYDLGGINAIGGDASAIIFDQNGWQFVALADYGQNGYDGVQTVDIPLSDFGGLDPEASVGTLHTRFWYGSNFDVEISSIVVFNSQFATPVTTSTSTPTPEPTSTPTPTEVAPTPELGTIAVRINSNTNDVEERFSDGGMFFTSSDIELGDDPGVNNDQLVGLRFKSLEIPQGAVIQDAYIEFETDETSNIATSVTIKAQAADDAEAFSNGQYNLSSRPETNSSVGWDDIEPWSMVSEKHQTPDLSSLVQEITNRQGWISGNDMVFMIQGSGTRTAESYDGEPDNAPMLYVSYQLDSVSPTMAPTTEPTLVPSLAPTNTPTPTVEPTQGPVLPGVELLSSPWNLTGNGGASEKYQSIDPGALQGMDTLRVTYNLGGINVIGGDASAIIFDQNGWQFVALADYGQNGYDGVQTVDIPLSDFSGLDPEASVGTLHTRFWYGSSFDVEISSIKVLDLY